jgi:cob(I)alamin adenosyltransferase
VLRGRGEGTFEAWDPHVSGKDEAAIGLGGKVEPGEAGARLRVADTQSARLEAELAEMNSAMPALKSFVLPGGTAGAAAAHVARTVTRRAERLVVALAAAEEVNPAVIRYLNRLSDHLFVLARRLNGNGAGDVLWVPGATRG